MRRWFIVVCCELALLGATGVACRAAEGNRGNRAALPAYRIETDGFGASEADIRAVLDSAGRELWQFFPDYRLEPIVVTRGHGGPITLFQRNDRGEIVVRLDTEKTSWCQYSYQFGHEFCHILCGFKPGYEGNKWFEETLCETASLYVMRGMSRKWKTSPPYPNWKDYHDALRDYVDDILRKRDFAYEIYAKGLPEFYRATRRRWKRSPACANSTGRWPWFFCSSSRSSPSAGRRSAG